MATRVIMPKLAANIEEATIGQWFKAEGDPVVEGELLFEAITDKAAVEVKAEGSGVLRKIYARENSVVPVGQLIAVIGNADEAVPEPEPGRPAPRGAVGPRSVKASFGARRLAKDLSVELKEVVPSRPDGRVTEEDVRRAAARVQAAPVLETIPLSPLRRALASHLARTSQSVAAAFVTLEVDFTAVEAALPRLAEEAGVPVLPRDVVVHAVARLLPGHRLLNACFTEQGIVVYAPVHVGLAVDVERESGVVVPVLHDADHKPLAELAREAAELVERARGGGLEPSEFACATFTVADQSGLGIDNFVPILNDRQSGILALSTVRRRPVLRGEEVVVAPVANLAVAFDHRVLNATAAARFLHAVQERLERFEGAGGS